jgi:hypothetical protein
MRWRIVQALPHARLVCTTFQRSEDSVMWKTHEGRLTSAMTVPGSTAQGTVAMPRVVSTNQYHLAGGGISLSYFSTALVRFRRTSLIASFIRMPIAISFLMAARFESLTSPT